MLAGSIAGERGYIYWTRITSRHCAPDTGFQIQALAVLMWIERTISRSRRLSTVLILFDEEGKIFFLSNLSAKIGGRAPTFAAKGGSANRYDFAPCNNF